MKALRVTGNVFIVIGATFLFFVLYELVGTSQITHGYQRALANEFADAVIERPVVTPSEKPKPVKWKPVPEGDLVGRIKIPSINLNWIVVEGTTLADLAKGPGHYTGTAYPGEVGSVGIAGHRTGWGSPFFNMDQVKVGDVIIIETVKNGTFKYRMTGSTIVHPGQTRVLLGDPKSDSYYKLTLTTCTPKYTSRDRLIVWADQISPKPVNP